MHTHTYSHAVTSCRACDQLRCTSCDFRVIYFNDYVWHARCDYLFFRNNVPDFEALKKNLVRKKGESVPLCLLDFDLYVALRLPGVCVPMSVGVSARGAECVNCGQAQVGV